MKKLLSVFLMGVVALMAAGAHAEAKDDSAGPADSADQVAIAPISKEEAPSDTIDKDIMPITIQPIDEKEAKDGKDGAIDPIDIQPIDIGPGDALDLPGDKDDKGKKDPVPTPTPTPVPTPISSGGGSSSGSGFGFLPPVATSPAVETPVEVTVQPAPESAMAVNVPYANGTLLRNKADKKIYVVAQGKLQHIRNLIELRKYAGRKIIDISAQTMSGYLAS